VHGQRQSEEKAGEVHEERLRFGLVLLFLHIEKENRKDK
jgi:hypothetical protein